MGQKDKLIKRLKSNPKDFTFEEAESLLRCLDYRLGNKGKTSGSRVIFVNEMASAPASSCTSRIPRKNLRAIK